MENKNIPYIVYEGTMARMERIIHRLIAWGIVMTVLFILSNIAWLYYESQFEIVQTTESYEAISDRGHAVINMDGEVNINGETSYSEDSSEVYPNNNQ